MSELNLTNTRDALAAYDRTQPWRNSLWASASTPADIKHALQLDADALRYVQLAFYCDTRDRNSFANCGCVDIEWIRTLITKHYGPAVEAAHG